MNAMEKIGGNLLRSFTVSKLGESWVEFTGLYLPPPERMLHSSHQFCLERMNLYPVNGQDWSFTSYWKFVFSLVFRLRIGDKEYMEGPGGMIMSQLPSWGLPLRVPLLLDGNCYVGMGFLYRPRPKLIGKEFHCLLTGTLLRPIGKE